MKEFTSSEITNKALEILRAKGFEVWRQNQIPVPGRAFIGKKGLSDVIGFDRCGIFVVCEVKKIGDTLKPHQKEFLNQVSKAGCHVYMAVQDGSEIVVKEYEPG